MQGGKRIGVLMNCTYWYVQYPGVCTAKRGMQRAYMPRKLSMKARKEAKGAFTLSRLGPEGFTHQAMQDFPLKGRYLKSLYVGGLLNRVSRMARMALRGTSRSIVAAMGDMSIAARKFTQRYSFARNKGIVRKHGYKIRNGSQPC